MRLRRGETVQTQTPSLPFWGGDHLRRPRGALGVPPRTPMRKPDASLRVRRSSRGLNRVWLDDSQSKRRLRSSSDCNAIWNKLRRHAAFSLSLLPGGKIPSKRGNAPTGKATGVTARPPFIGRIDIIIRCRLPFQIRSRHAASSSSRRPLAVRLMRLRRVETVPALKNPRHRLRVCPSGCVIICAVLAALSVFPPRTPMRKPGRFAAGAQIITVRADRMVRCNATRESSLDYMARCAP